MGKLSRSKGRRGETEAKHLLTDRDYTIVADTSAGINSEDLIVADAEGKIISVEVKNRKLIDIQNFILQARTNAKKYPWMLLCKIAGTSSWLVMGKNIKPVIWHSKEKE